MLNPLRSEGEAFQLLAWVVVIATAIIVLALIVRAVI
jgi:hypothetical protein